MIMKIANIKYTLLYIVHCKVFNST